MYNDNKNGLDGGDRGATIEDDSCLDKYKEHLDGLDLTDEQANELLRTLFDTMRMFVEMGISHDLCGQVFGEGNELPTLEDGDVNSAHPVNAKETPGQEEETQ